MSVHSNSAAERSCLIAHWNRRRPQAILPFAERHDFEHDVLPAKQIEHSGRSRVGVRVQLQLLDLTHAFLLDNFGQHSLFPAKCRGRYGRGRGSTGLLG
eukprot:1608972-Rhodomonas_salina.7